MVRYACKWTWGRSKSDYLEILVKTLCPRLLFFPVHG